jgi:hypothetical protein
VPCLLRCFNHSQQAHLAGQGKSSQAAFYHGVLEDPNIMKDLIKITVKPDTGQL